MTTIQQVTTVEEVVNWINDGLPYDEISDMLKMRHPDIRGLSSMSVRRFCSMNKIGKNAHSPRLIYARKFLKCS